MGVSKQQVVVVVGSQGQVVMVVGNRRKVVVRSLSLSMYLYTSEGLVYMISILQCWTILGGSGGVMVAVGGDGAVP
ncbi:hypothetical protein Hanom_Chr00s000006g01613341 [Helianthus anomalus]